MCDVLFWRNLVHRGKETPLWPLGVFLCMCVCLFLSWWRTSTWAWTSSWTRSTASMTWRRCSKSSSETCLILCCPESCTPPSCTPTVSQHTHTHTHMMTYHQHHLYLHWLLSAPPAVLRGTDQLQYLQHLLYLLPPCNCDTLLRLLSLLHTVQSFAQDSVGTNDEEVE